MNGASKLPFIHIADSVSQDMKELTQAELVAGKGIKGDRYYNGTGNYSHIPDIREITIIEKEALDALEQNQPPLQDKSIILKPHFTSPKSDHRRRAANYQKF